VSDLHLTAVSSIGTFRPPRPHDLSRPAGVTLRVRTDVSICNVLARKGADNKLADRVSQKFGINLPRSARYVGSSPIAFVWAGPSQWLALGDSGDARMLEQQLRLRLSGLASVTDQSDGRTIIRISGPYARATLAKGVLIDLHSGVFRPGDTAITTVGYIGVHFWQIDEVPTYEFATFRSFAVAFWEWVTDAAAEFEVAIE
jgi:methylglutamate dehydrogenase subunit D